MEWFMIDNPLFKKYGLFQYRKPMWTREESVSKSAIYVRLVGGYFVFL